MPADLVIHNARVVIGDAVAEDAGVAVQGGIISAVGRSSDLPEGHEMVDAEGAYLLPGLMDLHVHFREPGLTDREDFATGTRAAAAGGMTTIFDMPNTEPPTATAELVNAKRALVGPKALVDFGLYGLVAQDNLDEIAGMGAAGVVGFKFYLHQAIGKHPQCDDGALLEAFERVAETGKIAAVHAENPSIIGRRASHLRSEGRHEAAANLEARPDVSESEMVERCISFARTAGNRLHVCHATSARTTQLVREAKRRGLPVTAETGPQWLYFVQEDVMRKGTILMFSPPFRYERDRDALWEGLRDGTIDFIASDHAPRHDHEKICSSVWDVKSGFIGVETSAPVMLSGVVEGKLSLAQYVQGASERAARVFDLWPRKGSLVPGTDADLSLVSLGDLGSVDASSLHSKVRVTPFDGMEISARVVCTVVRGQIVARDGKYCGAPCGRDVDVDSGKTASEAPAPELA
jgi:dihydroorotase